MALNRQALDNFYAERKPYLEEIIGMTFKERDMKFPQFLNMKSATGGWIDMATVSGFGLWGVKAELEDAPEDDVVQGPVARATVVTYAQRHLVSQEAIEDDQGDGIIANRLPAMMRAGRATQEVLGHDLLNSGFATITTPDGLYLFSDSHVNLVGTTFDNLLAAADISQAGLETAILALENMTDDRNIPIMQTAAKIVIHPNSKWATQVILGSAQKVGITTTTSGAGDTAGVALATGYNDINPMYSQGLTTIESPYITDTNSWFVFASQHDLNWWTRVAPENWSEVDYVKSGVQIGARFRAAAAAFDARGVVGSAGS